MITRQHGCRLVLENEAGCWGATGLEAASIIRQVGSRNIGLCWDPGNSCLAGSARPYPDEYFQIKDLVSHVHMKNIEPLTDSWCLMDKGMVDWRGQLAALSADGYTGFLVGNASVKGGARLSRVAVLESMIRASCPVRPLTRAPLPQPQASPSR